MTITVNETRNEYTATAGQTVFSYTFKIFADTDLNVYQTLAGATADDTTDIIAAYTVTDVGEAAGGTIILTTGAAVGDLITIVSDIPETRSINYQNNGDFVPSTVNDDFDKMVSLVKQVNALASRTFIVQESQQNSSGLKLAAPAPGEFLIWNATGDEIVTASPSIGLGDMVGAQNLGDVSSASASLSNIGGEPADSTILKDADIGVNVQAYNADISTVSASQAEMEAGTEASLRSMSPLRVKQAVLTQFTSAEQTITPGGLLTIAHGLAAIPIEIEITLICKVADNGWSVGEVLRNVSTNSSSSSADLYNTLYTDSTNLYLRFSDNSLPFAAGNKTTGASASLVTTSWKLILRAKG